MKKFITIIKTHDDDKQGWRSMEEAQKVFTNATEKGFVNIHGAADITFACAPVIYDGRVIDCKWVQSVLTLKLELETYEVSEQMVQENLIESLEEFFAEEVEVLDLRETTVRAPGTFDPTRVYNIYNADELKPGDKVYKSDQLRDLKQSVEQQNKDRIGILEGLNDTGSDLVFIVRDDIDQVYTWKFCYLIERAPYKEPKEEPKLDVDVNVNIKNSSDVGSIKVQINGVEVTFKNIEDAKKVLSNLKEDSNGK